MLRARLRTVNLALALALAFGAGYGVRGWTTPPAPAAGEARLPGFGLFWEAWDLVQQHYVQPERADPKQLTYGAIEGMLDRLGDQGHTRFLAPDDYRRWQEGLEGQYVGIGVEVTIRDGRPLIVAPLAGSPAAEAGLRPGDLILAVEGKDTAGLTLDELADLLRGPEATSVTLTVRSQGSDRPRTLTIERRRIDLPSVAWTLVPGTGIAHLRLSQFAERADTELVVALRAARAAGARGLILDLRDNPGGLLDEAIASASEFLAGGVIVLVQARDGTRTAEQDRDGPGGAATDLPLVVLINEGSASSAEIVAGALKENGRAPLIGTRTFGTGTVLSTYPLSDGSAVLLGTSLWLTPDGHQIKENGIAPTIEVPLPPDAVPLVPAEVAQLTPAALRASPDRQLLRAIDDLAARLP